MSIPQGWTEVPLGSIARMVKGISYSSEDYCGPGEGALFITIKCVSKAGGFKPEGMKYYKGPIPDSQRLFADDIVFANTDLTRAGDIVGCPVRVPVLDGEDVTMSMDLTKLIEDPSQVDRLFLYYKLMIDHVRRFMKDHASGSTVLHLQTRAVPSLNLTIPESKPEQTKIAEILSTVDRAIEQTEALIAKQQRLKTGLMQDLLTRGIDEHGNLRSEQTHPFKDSPLGRIPVEWEVVPIKDVGLVVTGNTPSESAFADDYQSVPFVTPADVGVTSAIHKTTRSFGRASATNVRMIPPGSICVVCIGSTIGKIGVTVSEVATNQQINSVIPHEPEISYFLLHSMLLNLPPQLRKEAGLQAVPIVNKSTFERLLIAKPCNSKEAIEIQRQISSPAASAESGTHTLSKLRSLKTALMQDLVSGRKRVTDLLNNPEVPA